MLLLFFFRWARLPFFFFLLLVSASTLAVVRGQGVFECDEGSEERDENPIGTCACDGHLWVSQGCKEGYFCIEREGKGCYKVSKKNIPPICQPHQVQSRATVIYKGKRGVLRHKGWKLSDIGWNAQGLSN